MRGTGFSFIGFEMKTRRKRRIFIGFDFNLDIYGTIRVFFFFFFLWSLKDTLRTINVQEIFFRFFQRSWFLENENSFNCEEVG